MFEFGKSKTSVDSILSSFHKTIQDLNNLTVQKNEEADSLNIEIKQMQSRQEAAEAEAIKAEAVANKIANLLDIT